MTIMKKLTFILLTLMFLTSCKKENQLPTCTITYPNNGDEFEQGDTIIISVEANDKDGLIAEVRFYIDDIGIFSSTSFPYSYTWNTLDVTIGDHIIKVTAKDNDGGSQTDECTISIIEDATIVTTEVSSITHNSAMSGGNITDDGGASILERGVCWNTSQNPTLSNEHTSDGNGTGSFTSSLTGLTHNTTYYVKAYATNSLGTSYGSEVTFTTLTTPTLTTTVISAITNNSAKSGGNVTDDGGSTVTARGVCWSTSQNPTITDDFTTDDSGTGSYSSSLTGLFSETTYYVRAYATNSAGTAYGNEVSFKTWIGAVTDYDGNVYKIVQIGTQVWMAENLKTTKYNDDTSIPLVTDNNEWISLNTPAFCWYNNDAETNKSIYGALYNWYTVNTGKLCPKGWHIPTHSEWTTLVNFLGGEYVAGGKLKETGTLHWQSPNPGATNETGFTALPGGLRYYGGSFYHIGDYGWWWSATEESATFAWHSIMFYNSIEATISTLYNKEFGFSIRCVKDD